MLSRAQNIFRRMLNISYTRACARSFLVHIKNSNNKNNKNQSTHTNRERREHLKIFFTYKCIRNQGAQWLGGRVHDSRPGAHVRASPASLPCVLEQDTFILA